MVGPFYFVLHSWLAGIAGRNKLLINMKAHLQRCAFCLLLKDICKDVLLACLHLVQGSGVRALVAASPLFLLERCPEVAFKSPVTSHSYDTREGIVSHAWYEILRLSPHLFWLGVTHGAFSFAQDDDTRGRMGSHLGDMLRVLELAVLYTIRVGPWRRAAPKAQDGSTQRCEKLCGTIRFP